jgi:hypothetical protein
MKIRAYLSGDERAIMALDEQALPSVWNRRTLQNWFWKYTARNPAGESVVWVAEHNEKIVAHFAAVPYTLKTFDEEVTASHSIGALVEVKYQNRGLLKLVGDKMLRNLSERNIAFTWGFPNQRAYQFEKQALGYHDLINFDQWTVGKEKLERNDPYDLSFRKITTFDDSFDALWEECSPGYDVAVKRDSVYLNWRFIQRPDWWYYPFGYYEGHNLKGYVVLKLYREDDILRGHIVDIFARKDDRETLSRLIDGGMGFFAEQAVDEILVWFWGNPLIEELFIEKGWSKTGIDRPLILKVNTDHKYRDKVLDRANWYFTLGDSTEIF